MLENGGDKEKRREDVGGGEVIVMGMKAKIKNRERVGEGEKVVIMFN